MVEQPGEIAEWVKYTFHGAESMQFLIQALKTHKVIALSYWNKGYRAIFTFSIFNNQVKRLLHWTIEISPIKTETPKTPLVSDSESAPLFEFDPEDTSFYRAILTKC